MKGSGVHPEIRVKEEEEEHSPFGPSRLKAIILCPGRVKMSEGLPDHKSEAAAEGTVAHRLCEMKLNGKRMPNKGTIIIEKGHDIEVTKEMQDAVKMYVYYIDLLRRKYPDDVELVEGKVTVPSTPDVWGTVDYSLAVAFKTLYVVDFKFGKGIEVFAENNPQLIAYALGAGGEMIETYQKVVMVIIQPRIYGEHIKVWETTPQQLMDFFQYKVDPVIEEAKQDDPPLNPSEEACQWCRAANICPAFAKHALTVARVDFRAYSDINPDEIAKSTSIEQVLEVYHKLPLLKQFIKAVEGRVYGDLEAGQDVPGYKLVQGRKSRSWKDENATAVFLRHVNVEPYESKMLSPAKVEKLLNKTKKKEVQDFIDVKHGNPIIAREDDKRPAIVMTADDFNEFV